MKKKGLKRAASKRVSKSRGSKRPKSKNLISLAERAAAKQRDALTYFLANPTNRTPVERHEDERGVFVTIENVESFRNPIGSVAVLTRKAGSVFAEHQHEREGHTVYVVSGRLKYRELRGQTLTDLVIAPGGGVFSPPNVPHAFLAMEDSVCVVVANISRTQREYEADVRRLPTVEKLFSVEDVAAWTSRPITDTIVPPVDPPEGAPV